MVKLRHSRDDSLHYELFLRETSDRTIEVLNMPPYATESDVKEVFSRLDPVKEVTATSVPSTFRVTFEKLSSVDKALRLTSLEPLSNPITGLQKWIRCQNNTVKDCKSLQRQVDQFMHRYDKEVKQQKRSAKKVDDEGWTVVTKKSRTPGLSRKESVASKLEIKANKGKERKQLTDFYVFQKRESKMNQIVEMRKKYEEDKEKVNAMKQARRFRPYN